MTSPAWFKDALEVFARHESIHARDAANLGRLRAALDELDARYRDPVGRLLRPDTPDLAGMDHHLLLTRCGPVDVLGAIGHGRTYEDLLPDAPIVDLGGLPVRVLGLAALIRTKEEVGRDKDLAVLELLRKVLSGSAPNGGR